MICRTVGVMAGVVAMAAILAVSGVAEIALEISRRWDARGGERA
jgi:hypothetical protein